jgi:hypothetical protein
LEKGTDPDNKWHHSPESFMSTDEQQKRSNRGGATEEEQHGGEKGDARAAGRELWEGECKFMEAVGGGRLGGRIAA